MSPAEPDRAIDERTCIRTAASTRAAVADLVLGLTHLSPLSTAAAGRTDAPGNTA